MHSKSDNIEVTTYDNTKKDVEKFLNHFFQDIKLV